MIEYQIVTDTVRFKVRYRYGQKWYHRWHWFKTYGYGGDSYDAYYDSCRAANYAIGVHKTRLAIADYGWQPADCKETP